MDGAVGGGRAHAVPRRCGAGEGLELYQDAGRAGGGVGNLAQRPLRDVHLTGLLHPLHGRVEFENGSVPVEDIMRECGLPAPPLGRAEPREVLVVKVLRVWVSPRRDGLEPLRAQDQIDVVGGHHLSCQPVVHVLVPAPQLPALPRVQCRRLPPRRTLRLARREGYSGLPVLLLDVDGRLEQLRQLPGILPAPRRTRPPQRAAFVCGRGGDRGWGDRRPRLHLGLQLCEGEYPARHGDGGRPDRTRVGTAWSDTEARQRVGAPRRGGRGV
mmetsp:Transcript_29519/g.82472  ORF Transcript_29519/g.82472 Transcript_29519/m.82472 type:complete len:270 (-) Transcript_29519:229-1038(-)